MENNEIALTDALGEARMEIAIRKIPSIKKAVKEHLKDFWKDPSGQELGTLIILLRGAIILEDKNLDDEDKATRARVEQLENRALNYGSIANPSKSRAEHRTR